ncbi:hypothetical protein JZO86_14285 [Enterococcus ureasiticus]|uniref:hypothetical protein n=1 Tax=Enterococcus ureasiticus TaxID=903984 RepID=UPI001A8E06AE|nr:hypothetical protein [Enterococcus ureasiticus]MBO0474867.1 hypothetical protein [Enterococcus ureasiticus]
MVAQKKDPRVRKVEKKLTLLPSTIDAVQEFWVANQCSSFSDAVDTMSQQLAALEGQHLLADVIAEATAQKIVDSLKRTYLDPLRIRTGYADKQTKAMLEVLNHMIVKNGWDAENVVTTDVRKSNVLTAAEGKITKQIEHFKQNKATKDAKRKPDSP